MNKMNSIKMYSWPGKIFCLGFLALLLHSKTFAASWNVDINPGSFDPDPLTINVNDQVVWTWKSDFHNTQSSAPGLWDSGVHNTGWVFTNVFTTPGSFPYFCIVHGFTGTINVQAGNNPPTVSITSPTDGASFAAPAIVS